MKYLAVIAGLLLSACSGLVPPIADMNYAQVIQRAQSDRVLDLHPAEVERVRAVTLKIRAVAEDKFPDAKSWPWEYHVLSYPGLSSWAFPGAKVLIFSDMTTRFTEDELAMAVGHEVSHILLRHLDAYNEMKRTHPASVQTLNFQQNLEMEADKIGMALAGLAGYNPEAMSSFLKKMAADKPPCHDATCSHPSWERRIEQAKALQ